MNQINMSQAEEIIVQRTPIQYVFGVWAIITLALSVSMERYGPWPQFMKGLPDETVAAMLFVFTCVPFAYAAARLSAHGLSASRYSSPEYKRAVLRRFGRVWRAFPISATITLIVLAYPVLIVLAPAAPAFQFFVAVIAWFNALQCFIYWRVFLTRRGTAIMAACIYEEMAIDEDLL